MTATAGVLGINTQLKLATVASPTDFVLIKDVFGAIDGPSVDQEYVDFTHMQSSGGVRERKASFKTPGNLTFTCHYIKSDTQHEQLVGASVAVPTTLCYFQATYPDGTVITFAGYPSVKFNSDMAGKFTMAVTIGLEGSFTIA